MTYTSLEFAQVIQEQRFADARQRQLARDVARERRRDRRARHRVRRAEWLAHLADSLARRAERLARRAGGAGPMAHVR